MFFRQIIDPLLSHHAYLIGCESVKEAVLFEPERDIDRYFNMAEKNGYKIVAGAETHIHADYLSGLKEIAERGIKVFASDEGDRDWKYDWLKNGSYYHELLRHGDVFNVGNIIFKIIHTPGHTPEHICFEITEKTGGTEKHHGVITGDFMFVGDVGRPDLLETAAGFVGSAEISASRLYDSIQDFKKWPSELMIWPAHGAGSACGKSLGVSPMSTVNDELKYNSSVLAAKDKKDFIDYILSGQPEPPYYFSRMKKENKEGPAIFRRSTKLKEMTTEELTQLLGKKSSVILDGRNWEQFRHGHIKGTLFAPLDKYFILVAGSYIEPGTEIGLICDKDAVGPTVTALSRIGHDKVAGYITLEEFTKKESRFNELETLSEISVAELKEIRETGDDIILDVRNMQELVDSGQIEGAYNIAFTRLLLQKDELPKNKLIHVYCRSGNRSEYACGYLKKEGFKISHVAGGIVAWQGMGNKVVSVNQLQSKN